MTEFPNTRNSLLSRIADIDNAEAWAEFVEIYRPVIYRMARRRGCQDADAHDLTQGVLISVSRAIANWEPDASRAKFRTWLTRIVRNQFIDAFRKKSVGLAAGGSADHQAIQQCPESVNEDEVTNEYRRAIFRQAANSIRHEFNETTWAAFWLTAVEGKPPASVAEKTSRSVDSVYAARSRITKRLKTKIGELEMIELKKSQCRQDDHD